MRKKFFMQLGLGFIIFCVAIRSFFYANLEKRIEERTVIGREATGRIIIEELKNKIEVAALELENFDTEKFDLLSGDTSKSDILATIAKYKEQMNNVDTIDIVLENGQFIGNSKNRNEFTGIDNEEWYKRTKMSNAVTYLSKKKSDGTYVAAMSRPLISDGVYIGAITAQFGREFFSSTINNAKENLVQAVIKDLNGNIIYRHSKSANVSSAKMITLQSDEIMDSFAKYNLPVTAELYFENVRTENNIYLVKDIFSIIIVLLVLIIMFIIMFGYKNFKIGNFAFIVYVVIGIELIIDSFIVNEIYNNTSKLFSNLISEFTNEYQIQCDLLSENIAKRYVGEEFQKNVEGQMSVEQFMRYAAPRMKQINYFRDKTINLQGIYFINRNGKYRSYPVTKNDKMQEINFETNRILLNSYDVEKYSRFCDYEDFSVYSSAHKIYDKNGDYYGTFGVNLIVESMYDVANRILLKNVTEKIIVIDDNDNYNVKIKDIDGTTTISDIKLTNKQIEEMTDKDSGVFTIDKIIHEDRYMWFKNFGGNERQAILINLTDNDKIEKIVFVAAEIIFITLAIVIVILFNENIADELLLDSEKEIKDSINKRRRKDEQRKAVEYYYKEGLDARLFEDSYDVGSEDDAPFVRLIKKLLMKSKMFLINIGLIKRRDSLGRKQKNNSSFKSMMILLTRRIKEEVFIKNKKENNNEKENEIKEIEEKEEKEEINEINNSENNDSDTNDNK